MREVFKLAAHNLYASVDPGEPVYGLVFRTDRPGDIEASGLVFWDTPAKIESYEILDEGRIIDTFWSLDAFKVPNVGFRFPFT